MNTYSIKKIAMLIFTSTACMHAMDLNRTDQQPMTQAETIDLLKKAIDTGNETFFKTTIQQLNHADRPHVVTTLLPHAKQELLKNKNFIEKYKCFPRKNFPLFAVDVSIGFGCLTAISSMGAFIVARDVIPEYLPGLAVISTLGTILVRNYLSKDESENIYLADQQKKIRRILKRMQENADAEQNV